MLKNSNSAILDIRGVSMNEGDPIQSLYSKTAKKNIYLRSQPHKTKLFTPTPKTHIIYRKLVGLISFTILQLMKIQLSTYQTVHICQHLYIFFKYVDPDWTTQGKQITEASLTFQNLAHATCSRLTKKFNKIKSKGENHRYQIQRLVYQLLNLHFLST